MTDPQRRLRTLEHDLDLSETLRRQVDRENARLKDRVAELELGLGNLEEARASDQQLLFHMENTLAEWKGAIIDAAVVDWTYTAEDERNPRQAVNKLLAYAQQIALDPAVSKEARAWFDAVTRSEKARLDAEEARDHCLQENARLVELRRNAEASFELMKGIANRLQKEFAKQREITIAVATDRDRLMHGNFTADEIHFFCHNLPATVSREEFARGCREYQAKLYGRAEDVKEPVNASHDEGQGSGAAGAEAPPGEPAPEG